MQDYNSGAITGLDNQYHFEGSADFHVAMTDMLLKGFTVAGTTFAFPALRPDQVAIGLPASNEAGGGFTAEPDVQTALNCLTQTLQCGSYVPRAPSKSLRGLMAGRSTGTSSTATSSRRPTGPSWTRCRSLERFEVVRGSFPHDSLHGAMANQASPRCRRALPCRKLRDGVAALGTGWRATAPTLATAFEKRRHRMTTEDKAPIWFWIVAILLLAWEAMGCYACVTQIRLGAAAMGPVDDWSLKYYAALPAWYNSVYAVATFGGLAGACCSCCATSGPRCCSGSRSVAIIVMFGYAFAATDLIAHKGLGQVLPFPLVIAAIGAFSIWLSGFVARKRRVDA